MTYADPTPINASLPGPAQVLDFDALAPGTLLPSGSTQGGVTFNYAIARLTAACAPGLCPVWGLIPPLSPV